MRGQLQYNEVNTEGVPPNCVFTLAVTIEDNTYSGKGKSKKEAKKAAAQAALTSLYNITFDS